MSGQEPRVPWNPRIRRTVETLLQGLEQISGIPLEARHLPTGETLCAKGPGTIGPCDPVPETTEVCIANTPVLRIRGFRPPQGRPELLRQTLDLADKGFREYLQGQAEIESFSQELLSNYQALNLLYRISDVLGDIRDVQRVASVILNQAVTLSGAERGSVLLLDRDGRSLKIAASRGFSPSEMEELRSLTVSLSDSLVSRIVESGKPLVVEDIKDYPDLAVYSKGIYKTGSFLCLPLQASGDDKQERLLGVLNLSDKASSESFTSQDLRSLKNLAAHGSLALANAQAMQELRRSREQLGETLDELMKTYTDLEKRAAVIEQVNKISLAINATLELDQLFDTIAHYAKTLAGAEEATVYYRYGEETASESWRHGAGRWQNLISFPRLLAKGETFRIDHPESPLYLPLMQGATVEVRNLLAVPFFDKGRPIGAIAVANKNDAHGFTDEDRELLETLGNQAAIAAENARLVDEQKRIFLDTIMALAAAVDAKDPYTHNHSRNVALYSRAIAEALGLSPQEMESLERAAVLHDIGKIAVPEAILNKPGRLTPEEFEVIKTHPQRGVEILENIEEMAGEIVPAMKHHHERYDGKGYPDGLAGEEIPFLAQILAVADTYDAITSDRPYRKGPGHEFAVEEIIRCSGTQFSPRVVEAFLSSSICRNRPQISVIKS